MSRGSWRGAALGVLALLTAACASSAAPPPAANAPNALERYVARPDPAYGWKLVNTIKGAGYTGYVLELTSQSWRKASEVDRPVWTHWLTVIKPDRVEHDKALLYITGGNNGDPAPTKVSPLSAAIATETRSVVAELGMVPNQPLRFADSPDVPRYEDDIIAHVQNKAVATRDDEWIVRMAMVNSGVKAMDAVQAFMAGEAAGAVKLNGFVVAGGSKRGWTTWLVGAVDRRVAAIMPVVIDVLNAEPVTRHHYEALGYFSPALGDYVRNGIIPDRIGSPELNAARAIEDPYSYRDRPALRMPKYIINAAGDEFFLPTNSQFYYPDLQEEKRLRYVPNAEHSLAGSDAVQSMIAFHQAILTNTPRPEYAWRKRGDGALVVNSQQTPREVNLWQATNPSARDFRLDSIGPAYAKSPLQRRPDGTWVAEVPRPRRASPPTSLSWFTTAPAGIRSSSPPRWRSPRTCCRTSGKTR